MDEYDNSSLGQDCNLYPLKLDPVDHQLSQSDPFLFSIDTTIITWSTDTYSEQMYTQEVTQEDIFTFNYHHGIAEAQIC